MASVFEHHNATLRGSADKIMMLAHGFGCDQNMWRFVAPAFADDYRLLLFDHIGAGRSDLTQFDSLRHGSLEGYVEDVIALARAADMRAGVFVGHSVSAMIGLLAAKRAPELFEALVLIGPSPCYVNDGDYVGGFERSQIEELLEFLDSNHLGWSQAMAPVIMGNPDRPELGEELAASFCSGDPEITRAWARTTFFADNRADLEPVGARILILQCRDDVIAPICVGEYMAAALAGSELVIMKATGHCPNLSAPAETIAAMKAFL
jgi:sigma-B regulation protein RsbQ